MGKIADEPITMTTKVHAPTSEQLRIAQLLGDKLEDNAIMREKCQKVVETTGCSETMALIALHDCNNCIEDAVIKILDGTPEQGEWTVQEGRKAKKQQVGGYSLKDNATPSSEDINDDFDDINNKAFRRSVAGGVGGGSGVNHRSRSGGPPRLRGRGGGPGSRGQGPRRRVGGGNENAEIAANVNFDEHSSELSRKPGRPRGERGRGRGGGARGGSYAGVGTGGIGRRHVAEQPFDGGMSTWTNEAESNTWDNSMANNKWANNNNHLHHHQHQQQQQQQQQRQPQPQMDEWKGGNVAANSNNGKNVAAAPSANSNTWDNSMAQNVINPNKAMVAQPSANHIDEWAPDDWEGEEDWTSMKGRVFTSSTNMVQQQQPSMKSNSSVQPPQSNSTFSSKVADGGRPSDPTGIPSHLRGESIDVKSLFGQKPNDVNINDVSSTSASWSKQATDTLKNELGIGKVVSPNIDQSNQVITRDTRPFGKSTAAAKVEMPNSGPGGMSGLIDVEFGEFPTKLRNDDTSALFEYGSTAFNSSDLTALPAQSTKDQSGKNISMVYHGGSAKKDSQLNGTDMLLSTVGQGGQSSLKDNNVIINQSKQANDMLSASYPNATNTYIGSQDHQNQFPSRSSSLLVNNNQQQKASSGMPPGLPNVGQAQRSYLTNNSGIQSSAGLNESVVSPQLAKDTNLGQSQATLQTGQNIASGLSFNPNATRTTTAVTSASKPQLNQTLINPAANPSFQSMHQMAPYIYDQNYINALSMLSPPGIFPFDISALGQVPPLSNNVAALRDVSGLGGDVKQQYGRLDSGLSGGNNAVNAPPGLGPATANNAEQAAQLITPAAAAIQYSLMNTMQAPYFPFILPTVTNSTASTVSSGNQYAKNSVFSPVYYPTTNDALQQMQLDYSKNVYGVPASQPKQAQTSNMSLNANDVNNKAYPPGLKNAFDNKSFQNTATPPPAIGNVGYPPTAIHSSSGYGAYAGYLPHLGMNMMPPNIAQPTSMTNDVISGGGQRPTNQQVNKNNQAALYAQQKFWGQNLN